MEKDKNQTDVNKKMKFLQQRVEQLEKIKKSLRESEKRFKDIVDNAGEWVWEVDARGKYTYTSPVAKKILGYETGEILGKYFYDFFVSGQQEEQKQAAFNVINKKQPFDEFLTQKVRSDGRVVWFQTNAVPVFNEDGTFLGYRGTDTDITKFKEAQELEHREAAKLKCVIRDLEDTRDKLVQAEKINVVGQLASGVAHEVRNPLAIITQGVNYLERKLSAEKDIFDILKMMKDNVKRADAIVENIVDFSRQAKLKIRPQALKPIIENALILTKHNLKMDDVEIIEELKDGLPDVLVDEGKIEQVFVNVFLNAVQAMPNGGKLFIRTYMTKMERPGFRVGQRGVDYFKVGETAVIVEIEDTGVGIPQEKQQKVFEPFFTTKGPRGGTGLGLSITMNIIAMHRGLIEIESQEGKGTKIVLTLKSKQNP